MIFKFKLSTAYTIEGVLFYLAAAAAELGFLTNLGYLNFTYYFAVKMESQRASKELKSADRVVWADSYSCSATV